MNTVSSCVSLLSLHQRTVALQLSIQGRRQVLKGRGIYESDPDLGRVLRIDLPNSGAQFVLSESTWDGEILPGDCAGCDFLIRLN